MTSTTALTSDSCIDADFFKKSVEAGKKMLLFFNAFHDVNNSIKSEVEEVETFKKEMEEKCCCVSYNGTIEFYKAFTESLDTI